MFWAPNLFGGWVPDFLDLHYRAHPDCDHVAKFHGDWPRELGDLVAKKSKRTKEKTAVKHKAFQNYRSGRPKMGSPKCMAEFGCLLSRQIFTKFCMQLMSWICFLVLIFRKIRRIMWELSGVESSFFCLKRHIAYTTACCYRTSRDNNF